MSTISISYEETFKHIIDWVIFAAVTAGLIYIGPKIGEGLAYLWGLV